MRGIVDEWGLVKGVIWAMCHEWDMVNGHGFVQVWCVDVLLVDWRGFAWLGVDEALFIQLSTHRLGASGMLDKSECGTRTGA